MHYFYSLIISIETASRKFNINLFIAIITKLWKSLYKWCNQMLQIINYFKKCTLMFMQRRNGGLPHG